MNIPAAISFFALFALSMLPQRAAVAGNILGLDFNGDPAARPAMESFTSLNV